MSETGVVKGFKVFNPNWTCRDKQYTCPGHFEEDVTPSACNQGMHFCKKAADCFNYYQFNPENKVAEVVAYGTVVEDGDKCCTDKLEIIREIPWQELLEIVNMGKGCTGLCNSGNRNSGDWNSGDCNSGDCNSGDWNSGDWNSGDWNSGNRNSGDWNSGDWNSGDWNKTNFSNGCFNTIEPKIHLFNKPSEWTYRDWLDSDARCLLNQIPGDVLEYIWFDDMTDEEKAAHPEAETTGGYIYRKITVAELTDILGISQPYLYNVFKNAVGISPKQYIDARKIAKAKELLLSSYMSLTEIANSIGMNDCIEFSKFFKKHVGISPSKYTDTFHGTV